MAAYLVADVDVTDPVGFEEYRQGLPATLAAYGGRFLTKPGAIELVEGRWAPRRLAIVEFESVARVKAWLASPEYRALQEVRHRTAHTNAVIVDGL
jgi:uncharacterized protein (DUF1330 family)